MYHMGLYITLEYSESNSGVWVASWSCTCNKTNW